MQTHASSPEREERSYALIAVVAVLLIAVVAIVTALIVRREPDFALILATPQDCLRAFDDTKCREIVARAVTIHAATAPRFNDAGLCEMEYGACTPVVVLNATFFAPGIAAIAIAKARVDDPKAMIPLYFGSRDADNRQDGRRVYYHGLAVGILYDKRFGGAAISTLTDIAGKPLSSEAIKKLRG